MRKVIVRATNTATEVVGLYLALLLAGAIGFSLFEQKPFWDAVWWAAVTATSTGFGDMFPVTLGGRIVGGLLMHLSILVILPLIIGHIIGALIENQDRFTDAEQREILVGLAELRAATLARPWVVRNGDTFLALDSLERRWVAEADDALRFFDKSSALMAASGSNVTVPALTVEQVTS